MSHDFLIHDVDKYKVLYKHSIADQFIGAQFA